MEKAIALLPAAHYTVEEARKIISETLKRAFPDYDVEKVFWQSAYGVGLFWLAKLLYHVVAWTWIQTKVYEKHPEMTFIDLLGVAGMAGLGWLSPIVWRGVGELLGISAKEAEEEAKKENPILGVCQKVFEEYYGYISLGIPALFAFREYREYKKRKEIKELF